MPARPPDAAIAVEGVRVVSLARVVNERGHLLEVQRNDDDHFPGFGQAYITCTLPGVVKAWYRHARQFDQIALVSGGVLVALYDDREGSASCGRLMAFELGEERPALVQIPPGVWHGFKSLGPAPLYLLHLKTLAHDRTHPDEVRLPPDSPAIPFAWR
jgi:dTDP-4-dehydrorhamnose 3,5-epimerase